MAQETRQLLLMRHAKAAYPAGVTDVDRPLAERGTREAALAGDYIREHLAGVDAVLCSVAVRTRETLAATGITAPTTYVEEIYEATAGDIVAAVTGTDPAVRRLLVIGHSPGIPHAVAALATEASDPEALRAVRTRFPTSAFAVLEFDGEWVDLSATGARLVSFEIAR